MYYGTSTVVESTDVNARISAANKLFGSAKATFWRNSNIPFALRMRFYKAIIVNVLLWGCESWAIKSKEAHALRVFQFRCLRSILNINVMHKVSRERILELCQIQDIIQVMDLRRMRWIEKLSYMDVNSRVPRLLFSCWLYGNDYVRNTKPLKTIAHSHTDSLRRIAKASLAAGEQMIAPFDTHPKMKSLEKNGSSQHLFTLSSLSVSCYLGYMSTTAGSDLSHIFTGMLPVHIYTFYFLHFSLPDYVDPINI